MDISVIVCTRNRCEKLRHCLDHIRQLRFKGDWELIVVDNGSVDDTANVVKAFAAQVAFNVSLLLAPEPGVARARNLGLVYSRGRIIACMDDDCYPECNYLNHVLRIFRDPEIDFIGGRILLYDPEDAPVTIRRDTREETIPPRSFIKAGSIQGANIAFRRTVIERIGGYDPRFGPGSPVGSGDDIEFIARASAAAFRGGYFPGPTVYHHHGRKTDSDLEVLRQRYAIGRGAYYTKFLLRRETALLYAKSWFELLLKSRHARRRLPGEIRGAIRYSRLRLTEWLRGSVESDEHAPMS